MRLQIQLLRYCVVLILGVSLLLSGCGITGSAESALTTAASDQQSSSQQQQQEEQQQLPQQRQLTLAQLQEDFDEIKTTLDYFHPKLYTDVAALEELMTQQYGKLKEGMTPLQFYRLMAPVVAATKCGHSNLRLANEDHEAFLETARFLPFSIYWYGEDPSDAKDTSDSKALVIQNALVPQLPMGSQILSIDGVAIETVMAKIMETLAADGDNQTLKLRAINDGFRYYYALAKDVPQSLTIEYVGPGGGAPTSLVVEGVSKSALEAAGDEIWGVMSAQTGGDGSSGDGSSDSGSRYGSYSPYENHYRFEKDYAFLRMASFYPENGESVASYNEFIDGFFAKVKQEQVANVVLDVRDNFGGDPNVGAHLLSYLEKAPVPYFDEESGSYYPSLVEPIPLAENRFTGKLYVLMNGNSFSTTGHLLALLKYHGLGTMIGEESGGSFACTDASDSQFLPNTNMELRTSRSVFRVAVETAKAEGGNESGNESGIISGRGIMPDYPVMASLEAVLANEDVELAKALELMNGKK